MAFYFCYNMRFSKCLQRFFLYQGFFSQDSVFVKIVNGILYHDEEKVIFFFQLDKLYSWLKYHSWGLFQQNEKCADQRLNLDILTCHANALSIDISGRYLADISNYYFLDMATDCRVSLIHMSYNCNFYIIKVRYSSKIPVYIM